MMLCINLVVIFSLFSQLAFAEEKIPKLSRAAQHLYDRGFKSCSADLDKSVKWVHDDDNNYGLHGVWNEKTPDLRMGVVTTSEPYSDASGVTTFFATKDASGKCTVAGTTSMYFDKTCTSIRETAFKTWKFVGDISTTSIYTLGEDASLDAYLTPAKGGCLLIRRFTLYY